MATEKYTQFVEAKIAQVLWKCMSPCLITLGLVGNSLVFVVLTKSSMKQTTCSLYLRFLTVFDSLVLCVNLGRYWIIQMTHYDLRNYSPFVCMIHTWASYWVSYTSAWLLVFVTVERCFSVWFPHKVKMFCTKRKTYIIIMVIILIMALINSHFIYILGNDIDTTKNWTYCRSIYEHYNVLTFTWPWVDFLIYSFSPSTILSVCNISIIYKVISNNRQILQNSSSNESNTQNSSVTFRRSQESSLTAMLLVTSITYVLCTAPFCIFAIYYASPAHKVFSDTKQAAVVRLVFAVVNMLQFTNNCINFILYCVSGRRFRAELKNLCCFKEPGRPGIYNVPTRNTQNSSRDT